MENVNKQQLDDMLQGQGLELSQDELERLVPIVQKLGQELRLLRSADFGLEEIGAEEASPLEIGAAEVGTLKVGEANVGALEVTPCEVSPRKIYFT